MRPSIWPVLLFGASLTLLGVSCTQTDPELEKPCSERKSPTVTMGIGQYSYVPLAKGQDQGPFIDTDLNTGDFVWLGVACTDLGPNVTLDFGIKDSAGNDLSITQGLGVTLGYNSSASDDEAAGLQAILDGGAFPYNFGEQLVGDQVVVWADVTDECHDAGSPVQGHTPTRLEGYDLATCPGCLDQECHTELGNCGSECHAVQGCLDAYCVNLSALGSPDEALCQAYCQGVHPMGKDAHIAVVSCVQDMARGGLCTTQTCLNNPVDGGTPSQFCYDQSPCYPYSLDYQYCVRTQDDPSQGVCNKDLVACNLSTECLAYQTCTASCTNWPACQACAHTTQDPTGAGELLYEQHQRCIENTCLAQGWIIHEL